MVAMESRALIRRLGGMLVAGLVTDSDGIAIASETMSVSAGSWTNGVAVVQGDLEITSSRDGHVSPFNGSVGWGDERHDTFSVSGKIGYEDLVGLKLRSDFVDLWQFGKDGSGDFAFAEAGNLWEENAVGDTEIDLSSFGDRLLFTFRRAWSSYNASPSYLQNLRGSEKRDALRFTGGEQVRGGAMLYRADAVLWKTEDKKLSVFAQQSEVDLFFESVAVQEDDKNGGPSDKKNPFATPNQETLSVGAIVGVGPMQVTLRGDTLREVEESEGNQERRQGALVWIDLDDLRSRVGEAFQGGL